MIRSYNLIQTINIIVIRKKVCLFVFITRLSTLRTRKIQIALIMHLNI